MVKEQGKELIIGLMEKDMKGILKIIYDMEKELIIGLVEIDMRGIL